MTIDIYCIDTLTHVKNISDTLGLVGTDCCTFIPAEVYVVSSLMTPAVALQ